MANFSFDITSEYDKAEMNNVFALTQKEIVSRYDFKGTPAEIDWLGDNRLVEHRREQTAQSREAEDVDVVGGEFATYVHDERGRRLVADRADENAGLAGDLEPRCDLFVDGATGDVDRVEDEVSGQRQPHAFGDVGAGPVLSLAGRGAGAGSRRPAGARTAASRCRARWRRRRVPRPGPDGGDRVGEGLLVDETTTGGVDDDHALLGPRELLGADQTRVSGVFGELDGDEVGALEQFVEADQLDPQHWAARAGDT